jgi:hypothetical protein
MRWHVEGTYNPSDRGSSKTGNHMVLDEPLHVGRLVRKAGDPLCKPAKSFWGLTGPKNRPIDCHHCVKQALRLGLGIDAAPSLDLGRHWQATLAVEGGLPKRIDLRSRWFRQPPLEPPTPPDAGVLLRAVQAIAPSVRAVQIDRLDPVGVNEVAGMALVE